MRHIFICALTASVISSADISSVLQPLVAKPTESTKNFAPLPDALVDSSSAVEPAKPIVAGFDVYGSPRMTAALIKKDFGTEIDQWLKQGLAADPAGLELEKKLSQAILKKYDLALAEWSIVEHIEPPNIAIYITLDVVEKKDASRRMKFSQVPSGTAMDPGGLISLWDEYQKLGLSLVEIGEVQLDAVDCEAFHCPFGHMHPKLQKYEKLFVEGVKKNSEKLAEVITQDPRLEARAAAAFLLAYGKDGKMIVDRLLPGIKDPNDLVRNNVMRVLGDISEFHPEVLIPTKLVADALEYPRVSDRSKAVNIVYFLAMSSPQARQYLMENSLSTLIGILGAKQPDHRVAAHAILRKLAGKNYGATDTLAWSNWAKRLASPRMPSKVE